MNQRDCLIENVQVAGRFTRRRLLETRNTAVNVQEKTRQVIKHIWGEREMFDKKAYDKKYYQDHKSHMDAIHKNYMKKHPDLNAKYCKEYKKRRRNRT